MSRVTVYHVEMETGFLSRQTRCMAISPLKRRVSSGIDTLKPNGGACRSWRAAHALEISFRDFIIADGVSLGLTSPKRLNRFPGKGW